MNSNHCHEWPIFHQVVFRRPSLSSEFHFESTESKSLISTQSLFSLASRIKTQTVCPSRIWWLSNSEEGSVPSGKDVLVFLCTAFSISIHNLLAALCWTSVGLPSWQEGPIPSECKCPENTLAASYNYILFGQYLLSYFGLMQQYVLFFAERDKQRQTITIFYCSKEVQASLDWYSVRLLVQTLRQHISLEGQGCEKLATVTGEGLPMEGIWIDGWFKWANIWDAPRFLSSKGHATNFFVWSLTVAFTEWGLHAIHFLDPNSKPMHQRFPGIQYKYLQC